MTQGNPTGLLHTADHLSGKSHAADAATVQSTFCEEAGKNKIACSSVRHIGHSLCLAMILSAHSAHGIVCRHVWKTVSTGDSMQISVHPVLRLDLNLQGLALLPSKNAFLFLLDPSGLCQLLLLLQEMDWLPASAYHPWMVLAVILESAIQLLACEMGI